MADERLGASFSIDITELKAGLKTANKLIKESQSEFQAAAAGLDNWRNSEEGLNAKIKSLNSIIDVQEKKVEALKKEYQRLVDDGLDEASDRAIELRTQINKEEAALESNKQELKKQTDALEDLENQSDETGDEIEQVGDQAEKSSGGFTILKGAIADLVADGFRMAISAAKDFAKEMVNVGMTFDDSMAQVAAISGATGDELQKLRDKAKEMGSTTKFTASEAAEAFTYMAMAGWKTEDMLEGIEGILSLAASSGTDLATTSDIVTDALTAMGYGAGDAGRLANVMAAASSNANTNVGMMGETFKYAAPLLGAMGYSMEDTAVAVGLMANAGVKASMAGTALRGTLSRLAKPTKEMNAAMEALGLTVTKTTVAVDSDKLQKAQSNVASKTAAMEKAQITYNAAIEKYSENLKKAQDNVAKKTAAVEKAQISLNAAVEKYGKDSAQAQKASVNLETAQSNLAKANEELQKKQEESAEGSASAQKAAINLKNAQNNLSSAYAELQTQQEGTATSTETVSTLLVDENGNMRSLMDVMKTLREKMGSLDEATQAQAASAIFGQEAMSGMLAIVNASEEDFNKLVDAVEGAEGAAESMADTMLDTLGGDMTVLNSQLDGVRLTIYEKLEPTLRGFVKEAQKVISKINWEKVGKKANDILKKLADTAKNFAKSILPTAKKALEVLGKVLGFVVDNFQELLTAVVTGIAVFTTFKAVLAISSTIKAVSTAMEGLTEGIGFATKAQKLLNGVMEANPMGAVLTAVGFLTAGLVLLNNQLKKTITPTETLTEKQRDLIDATNDQVDAFEESRKAAEETAKANTANVDYVRDYLLPQLKDVVDANGKVKEGEEARAQYILNELNSALGTEYESLQDIVDANGQIKDSIYDVIDARKAQILLDAYQNTYADAIKNVTDSEKARATIAQELASLNEELAEKTELLAAQQEAYDKLVSSPQADARNQMHLENIASRVQAAQDEVDAVKLALDQAQANYDKQSGAIHDYYNTIQSYQEASTAVLNGETQKAIDILTQYSGGFKTAANTIAQGKEEQKKILEQQVVDTQVNLRIMEEEYKAAQENMTDEEKTQAKARLDAARKQAEDAKEEYYKVGGDIVKGMVKGVEDTKWVLNESMRNTITDAVKAAKEAAGIKSPSKLFRQTIGLMIGKGIALGIDDSTNDVVSAVKTQVQDLERAYNMAGFENSVNAGMMAGGSVNNSRSITVNQTNNYAQAHSRYELYKSKQQTAAAVRLAMGTV